MVAYGDYLTFASTSPNRHKLQRQYGVVQQLIQQCVASYSGLMKIASQPGFTLSPDQQRFVLELMEQAAAKIAIIKAGSDWVIEVGEEIVSDQKVSEQKKSA